MILLLCLKDFPDNPELSVLWRLRLPWCRFLGRPFLNLPDEDDKEDVSPARSGDDDVDNADDPDDDDAEDAENDDADGKESSIRSYEASGLSTVAESVGIGADEEEEEEMDLDKAWEGIDGL